MRAGEGIVVLVCTSESPTSRNLSARPKTSARLPEDLEEASVK